MFKLTMPSIFSQVVEPEADQILFIDTDGTEVEGHRLRSTFARRIMLTGLALVGACALVASTVASASGRSRHSRFLQASVTLPSEMQAVLDQHNVYRCMHGVPLLQWDTDVAANAQAWADIVPPTAGHSSTESRTLNGVYHGENAGSCTSCVGVDRVISWYSEIERTSPYGLAQSSTDSTVEGKSVGHYTQVVWQSTTKLGCGTAKFIHHSGSERDYWVCQYGPGGNYGGQYGNNVFAPVKSEAECTAEILATTTTTTTTTAQLQCQYIANLNTAVKYQGTGGSKLMRVDYESVQAYLEACQLNCNADSRCGGFVDDPTDRRGRMCKSKTATEGYAKALKTFYRKGSGC